MEDPRGLQVAAPAPYSFSCWEELASFLSNRPGLMRTEICLVSDLVGGNSFADYGTRRSSIVDEDCILLEISLGYRARLIVEIELEAKTSSLTASGVQSLEILYEYIAEQALWIYRRDADSRMVQLMAEHCGVGFAWFVLDREGSIRDHSREAERFCSATFGTIPELGSFFPSGLARYIAEAVQGMLEKETELKGELIFAAAAREKIASCVLRETGAGDFLLSIAVSDR